MSKQRRQPLDSQMRKPISHKAHRDKARTLQLSAYQSCGSIPDELLRGQRELFRSERVIQIGPKEAELQACSVPRLLRLHSLGIW